MPVRGNPHIREIRWRTPLGSASGLGRGTSAAAIFAALIPLVPLTGCRPDGAAELDAAAEEDSTGLAQPQIHRGSGSFLLEGGVRHPEKEIEVFFHRPESFSPDSPVLIVVPGAGRNGDEYRDAWVTAAEAFGVLVLSPTYAEVDYDFGAYHLGGLLSDVNLAESTGRGQSSNEVTLDEDRLTFVVNRSPDAWIFNDFDRLFEVATAATGSIRERYDLFGHSAGGQILHRLVLFHPRSKADRILAANSGFYTLPDPATPFPFGLRDAPVADGTLEASFEQRLVVFLGEEDDENESGGTLLRSPTADMQGIHRLARGRHFYETSQRIAEHLGAGFEWSLEVVPGVGHDFRAMSEAAADYLYGGRS